MPETGNIIFLQISQPVGTLPQDAVFYLPTANSIPDFIAALASNLSLFYPNISLINILNNEICIDIQSNYLDTFGNIRAMYVICDLENSIEIIHQPICETCLPVPNLFIQWYPCDESNDNICYANDNFMPIAMPNDLWRMFLAAPEVSFPLEQLTIGLCINNAIVYENIGILQWFGDYATVEITFPNAIVCARLCIYNAITFEIVQCSEYINIDNHCFSVLIRLSNCENAFGFPYATHPTFKPQFRISCMIYQPQFVQKQKRYTTSNGQIHLISSRINKEWNLETDYLDEFRHESMVIAFTHDRFEFFEKDEWVSAIADENYQIQWQKTFPAPLLAKANVRLLAANYDKINDFCKQCF